MVAAGTPIISAIRFPAASMSSGSSTNGSTIAIIACMASGLGRVPENLVTGPAALIMGVTPRLSRICSPLL